MQVTQTVLSSRLSKVSSGSEIWTTYLRALIRFCNFSFLFILFGLAEHAEKALSDDWILPADTPSCHCLQKTVHVHGKNVMPSNFNMVAGHFT